MAALLAACGDDESAQDRYCAAGEELGSSLGALTDLDLIAEGTSGLESAVQQVQDDVSELRDAATDATSDDVDALNDAIGTLESASSDLGGDLTSENAAAVSTAIQGVASAAGAVFDTLGDC